MCLTFSALIDTSTPQFAKAEPLTPLIFQVITHQLTIGKLPLHRHGGNKMRIASKSFSVCFLQRYFWRIVPTC